MKRIPQDVGRGRRLVLILAFLLPCVLLFQFLRQFTIGAGTMPYLMWETSAAVSSDGAERFFDPMEGPPALKEGEFFRFSVTLPEREGYGSWLIFENSGVALTVTVDGTSLYVSTSELLPDTANLGQVHLPLPPGGGERLVMELRPLGETMNQFPPLLRLTDDPSNIKGIMAIANHFAFPAGATALALFLLWGLFLLGVLRGAADPRLLLPILAAVGLTVYPIALSCGYYFLPEPWRSLFIWDGILVLSGLLMLLFLFLGRSRDFLRTLGWTVPWSAVVLGCGWAVSALRGGYLASYLSLELDSIRNGYFSGLLYWVTVWLVGVCVGLSAWELVRTLVQTTSSARALALKNELVMENYRSIETRLRESAAMRHEFSHQLTALSVMYEEGDLEGIGRLLTDWKGRNLQLAQPRFTEHIAVNAILQSAAARAEEANIRFEANVLLPRDLPIPNEDLCTLLLNLLDNALEGAAKCPRETEPFIRLRLSVRGGFFAVFCENSFNGQVVLGQDGRLHTTKADPETHGFGLPLMRRVAEKYKSILDVSHTGGVFVVQTALKLPEPAASQKQKNSGED